jgi:hypothetical protein
MVVYGAKQMPYVDRKLLTMNSDFPDKHFLIQSLEMKRKHIENAKKYVGNQDASWWDIFFLDQQKICIDFCLHDFLSISMPFLWSLGNKNLSEFSDTLLDDLTKLIRPN